MRYLVTGGAGFIGSHVVDALTARGESVVVIDDLSTGRRENLEHLVGSPSLRFVEGTVMDQNLMDECMRTADVCLHLASAVGVQLVVGQSLDSLLRNVRGSDVVMEAAARHGVRLLFASTSEIYGKSNGTCLDEDSDRLLGSPRVARWGYSTTKAFGEALAHSYHRELGAENIVVRLFNTVGPRQCAQYGMVVPRFVRQALAGDDLTVYGNGTQTRCFTHVADVVQALVALCDCDAAVGGTFNIGTREPVAVVELARRVIERTGGGSRIALIPYDEAYDAGFEELGCRTPDTRAVAETIGWSPSRTIDDAIDDILAFEETRRVAPAPRRLELAR